MAQCSLSCSQDGVLQDEGERAVTLAFFVSSTELRMLRSSDMLVFSHLRWSWVYQRPQHLMTRAAQTRRVFFVEEPSYGAAVPRVEAYRVETGVIVVTPYLPPGLSADQERDALRQLMAEVVEDHGIQPGVLWYFTPSAMPFTVDLAAETVVYDCMDELTGFAGAPAALVHHERQLLARADIVFTGGWSLYEVKRTLHANVHAMPSGVDLEHFRRARDVIGACTRPSGSPNPRIGFAGVLDERLDLEIVHTMTAVNPDWQFVFAGPVTKIDSADLPRHANVSYLGQIPYAQLPTELASWDVAWIPFAQNSATRFISPTKTPEYLAAGLRVVSTPINDVVRAWGDDEAVTIAATAEECAEGIRRSVSAPLSTAQLHRIDRVLAGHSWDAIWIRMSQLMLNAASNAA